MAKREKIILTLMVLSILYGAYIFLQPGHRGRTTKGVNASQNNRQELDNLIKDTTLELSKCSLSPTETYIISKAEAAWPRSDLFLTKVVTADGKSDAKSPLADKFTYSGFVQVGNKKMAIINGLEYKTGDIIDPEGFIVRAIFPTRVLLEGTDQTSGDKNIAMQESITIAVPLAE